MSRRFGSQLRLRKRGEFTSVQGKGRRVATPYLTLLALPNRLGHDRLGVVASRRFGSAVVRNRAKRRVRALFRLGQPDDAGRPGYPTMDLVVIPRRPLLDAPYRVLEQDFAAALCRMNRREVSVTWPVRIAQLVVRAYQLLMAPLTGGGCRFEPSCSNYALQAVEEHGVLKGLVLSLHRVARCHPFSKPGIDPVPPRRGA